MLLISIDTPRSLHLNPFASPRSPHLPHWPSPMTPGFLSVSRLHLCAPSLHLHPPTRPAHLVPFPSLLWSRLIHPSDFTSIPPLAPPLHLDAFTAIRSPRSSLGPRAGASRSFHLPRLHRLRSFTSAIRLYPLTLTQSPRSLHLDPSLDPDSVASCLTANGSRSLPPIRLDPFTAAPSLCSHFPGPFASIRPSPCHDVDASIHLSTSIHLIDPI